MKTRITIYIIAALAFNILNNCLARPVGNIVKNTSSLATINGGNAEYIANESINYLSTFPWTVVINIALFFIFFFAPIKNLIKSK